MFINENTIQKIELAIKWKKKKKLYMKFSETQWNE